MASNGSFLTDGQREILKVATQNPEVLSSSPKSLTSFLSEQNIKSQPGGGGGKTSTGGNTGRHVRRTHSGKLGRAKKGT